MNVISPIRTQLSELDASRRRTEARRDLNQLLRQAMGAAAAAAYRSPDRHVFFELGRVHCELGDLARAVASLDE